MSWSLQVRNGDLSLGGKAGLATVTGPAKLVQDLKHWMLSPQGSDPLHLEYGSVIDGGVGPNGEIVDSFMGNLLTPELMADIETEIRRVCSVYQQQQIARLNEDTLRYSGKYTLSASEILSSVNDIIMQQFGTALLTRVHITTAAGANIALTQAVNGAN